MKLFRIISDLVLFNGLTVHPMFRGLDVVFTDILGNFEPELAVVDGTSKPDSVAFSVL